MIDDSHTMKKHWGEVQNLAKLLAYIVKATDPDGIDLYFLSSKKRHNFKNASDVYATVRDYTPTAFTNLNSRLNDDLSTYARDIERRGKSFGLLPIKSLRKRSIYVLTDGLLHVGEATQGQDAIKMIVEKVVRAGMMRGQVGIQLISFGNDANGLNRLQKLDHLNQDLKLGLYVTTLLPTLNDSVTDMSKGCCRHGAIDG